MIANCKKLAPCEPPQFCKKHPRNDIVFALVRNKKTGRWGRIRRCYTCRCERAAQRKLCAERKRQLVQLLKLDERRVAKKLAKLWGMKL